MKEVNLNEINWKEIQDKHNNGEYWNNLPTLMGISRKVLENGLNEGYITKILHTKKMSDGSKLLISNARKKFLKENPDKHPWKNNDKFKSVPCELLKMKLKENETIFFPEYTDLEWSRLFSIDIAFPNKKIGIEVNGNQHYNNDGTLKDYYKDKHDFFVNLGWEIFEIHYSFVYNKIFLDTFLDRIKDFSLNIEEYDDLIKRLNEQKTKKENNICPECGGKKYKEAEKCNKCTRISLRKVKERPSHDELKLMIIEHGYSWTGRKYNVSDVSIRKWEKSYE
jgi:ribosomal protein L40E